LRTKPSAKGSSTSGCRGLFCIRSPPSILYMLYTHRSIIRIIIIIIIIIIITMPILQFIYIDACVCMCVICTKSMYTYIPTYTIIVISGTNVILYALLLYTMRNARRAFNNFIYINIAILTIPRENPSKHSNTIHIIYTHNIHTHVYIVLSYVPCSICTYYYYSILSSLFFSRQELSNAIYWTFLTNASCHIDIIYIVGNGRCVFIGHGTIFY
jgi:hypothetical protein